MGVKQAIKALDAFPRAEEHLLQKTQSGAFVSVVGLVIMATLFIHELSYYLTTYEVHQLPDGLPQFIHINQNSSSGRKHIKQKKEEEDIHICVCEYSNDDPNSACEERCLNVLTNIECTPGYCPCGESCKNQKFQKCEYAKTKLFKTEGRGWGLLADENIKAGQFIIEYCGEIISSEEAKQRFLDYESQGVKESYIISLNTSYFIDATNLGSLARFINHSCKPNCVTRKWKVLGETRVGIFAKEDICIGTELAYDYNFEWYGSSNVRCLCGAPNCSLFLGAKSRGFLENNHVWEEGDARYTVDEIPTYDSSDDEPSSQTKPLLLTWDQPFESATPKGAKSSKKFSKQNTKNKAAISESDANGNSPAEESPNKKAKFCSRKQVSGKQAAKLFSSKQVQDEILKYEEIKDEATAKLDEVYNEIRPVIEEQDSEALDTIRTNLAEKWIQASCAELSASFDLYSCIIESTLCPK